MLSVRLCVCVPVDPPLKFWMPELIFMKLHIYNYGTSAHLNSIRHKSLPSFSVSVCVSLLFMLDKGSVKCTPPFVVKQRLCKHVPVAKNTRNSGRIVGRVCLWVCLCIPLPLLGNNSVNTFPRQRKIVGGVVSYAVHVVCEKSRRLVIPRTSCYL
jgi:hypothetical protein